MKKPLLATGLLATMVLGNVAMAAEIGNIDSTNIVKIDPGKAAITAAPSYEFPSIKAEDVAKGEKESDGKAVDKENPESIENIQETVDFSNNTLKDVKLTVKLGKVTDKFLTGVTYTYDSVKDVVETEDNEITNIDKIEIGSDESHEVISATDKVGEHNLSFGKVKANYKFNRSNVNQSNLEGYSHELVWSLTDGTEKPEVKNSL